MQDNAVFNIESGLELRVVSVIKYKVIGKHEDGSPIVDPNSATVVAGEGAPHDL